MTRLSPSPLALVPILLFFAAPAFAQTSSGGCPPPSAIEANDQILIGRTWLPMRIGIDMARASCRAHDFLANFFKRQPDPDSATLDDIVEASKPDQTSSDSSFGAKVRAMPSPTKSPGWNPNPSTRIVVLPLSSPEGVPVMFQPNAPGGPTPNSVDQIDGNGTLISSEGMKRGTFKQGKLNGVGEEIDPNGTWRSGTFQNGTNMGYVYEVRSVNGKTYIAAGSVVNGKLDGMIERVYADGSTQFEDWEDGRLMQVGLRAPKGIAALAPQARYKPPVEVATTDAYKKTGPQPKITPGTTFNPAETTRTSNGSVDQILRACPLASGALPNDPGQWQQNVLFALAQTVPFLEDLIARNYPYTRDGNFSVAEDAKMRICWWKAVVRFKSGFATAGSTISTPARQTNTGPVGIPPDLKLPKPLISQMDAACGSLFPDVLRQAAAEQPSWSSQDAGYFVWRMRQHAYAKYMGLRDFAYSGLGMGTSTGNGYYEAALQQAQQYPSASNRDTACVLKELRRVYGARP